jgi:hypothetical protein
MIQTGKLQLYLLNKSRQYLWSRVNQASAQNIMTTSGRAYLNSWSASCLGWSVLRSFSRTLPAFIDYATGLLRNFYYFFLSRRLQVHSASLKRNYRFVVISWCKRSDFSEDGGLLDRYLSTHTSQTQNCLWIYLSLDNYLPEKLQPNIVVLTTSSERYLDLRLKTKLIKEWWSRTAQSWRQFSFLFSYEAFHSFLVSDLIASLPVDWRSVSLLFQPYEAQPFQHAVNFKIRSLAPEIRCVGYLHSAPPPLPTDLIFRPSAPDVLLIHGKGQLSIMNHHLGWPLQKIAVIPSLRYKRDAAFNMSGQIFLPYDFQKEKVILKAIHSFLRGRELRSLPLLKVKMHPAKITDLQQIKLKDKIETLLTEFADRFDAANTQQVSIFIGATAAILEALARGCEVIHITSEPILESHSSAIWSGMKVEQISSELYIYKQDDPATYIELGSGIGLQDILNQYA